ncbi:uncharacterized protein LOC130736011 [Lotus japonicus]|uniref:uncharacterized protein LOC130736011 n=1 Tax=Lotus japonicus TaxID=34305 RepID=UPI00258854FA|nr:uncharacterized protein LOC130736011 [Lotus japonicus]
MDPVVTPFHTLSQLSLWPHIWTIKVRVIGFWKTPEDMMESSHSSLNMVLIDREAVKIEAYVCKEDPMTKNIVPGCVYKFSIFQVTCNHGDNRVTNHRYKLLLHSRTLIFPSVEPSIPFDGYDFLDIGHIRRNFDTFTYLIDIAGLVSSASKEKLLIKNNTMHKMITVELVDTGGRMRCLFVGDIVSMFVQYLCSNWTSKFVVGLQFAALKYVEGKLMVKSIPNVTKLHLNPIVEEQSAFAERFRGFEIEEPVAYIGYRDIRLNLQDDFINLHPAKTLAQLIHTKERGVFIVRARIVSVIKGAGWAYPSCRCYTELKSVNDGYSCSRCFRNMVKMIHRYRVKVEVYDGLESAVFVLGDPEAMQIIERACEEFVYVSQQPLAANFPREIEDKLVGAEVLFKIRNDTGSLYNGHCCYDVLRICSDTETMDLFTPNCSSITPLKSKFVPPFTYLEEDSVEAAAGAENVVSFDEDELMSDMQYHGTQFEGYPSEESTARSVTPMTGVLPLRRKLFHGSEFGDGKEPDGIQVKEGVHEEFLATVE